MTSEATILQVNNLEYRQVTVDDASAFAKGTMMYFEGGAGVNARVNHYANGQQRRPAGVLAVEKVASDGQTTLPVLVQGTVEFKQADNTATIGMSVVPSSLDNAVAAWGAASLELVDRIIGIYDQGAAAGGAVRVRLQLG